MKKTTGILGVLLMVIPMVHAEKVADLPDIIRPASIRLDRDTVYIVDQTAIHIYSLKPFKRIKTFGAQGQGPGEFNSVPFLKIYPEKLFINCLGKIMTFSHDGEFVKQTKLPFRLFYFYYPILQVGLNYAAFPMVFSREENELIHYGKIYDQELSELKVFYNGGKPQVPPPPRADAPPQKIRWEVIPDCLDFDVMESKIFVADSRKGFYIGVFNDHGTQLYEIDNKYEKIKVPKSFRDDYMKERKESDNWEQLKASFEYVFRDYYPAFFTVKLAEGIIYAATYAKKNGKYELVQMDLEGKILRRSFSFPLDRERRIMDGLIPYGNEFDIHKGKIYYLVYNDENSRYELHRATIQ